MDINTTINCISCGSSFQRKRPQFAVWVCPSCFKVHNDAYTNAPLRVPEDMTLLTLDSTLEIDESRYVFTGRYHYQLLNSYKNNWVLSNEMGELAYFIEAKGYYAFCKKWPKGLTAEELRQLSPGNDFFINEQELYVDGVDKNELTYYAGELPEIGEHAGAFFSADLSNNRGGYAFVQLFDKKHADVYLGKWGAFSDFKLNNTRKTDGWK